MTTLVLGASGMLGSAMMHVLGEDRRLKVWGTIRRDASREDFPSHLAASLRLTADLTQPSVLAEILESVRPDAVVNCVGLRPGAGADFGHLLPILAVLPQQLGRLCARRGIRLIQISSDGVFSGRRGRYSEEDLPDPIDPYGTAKLLGELRDPHAITLRTSMIGPELRGSAGLLEWFLCQSGSCRGYTRTIFSGLPTAVLAEIVRDIILPRGDLRGIFHLAAEPISKFELLRLIAEAYGKDIKIVPDDSVILDRSLVAEKFRRWTGYRAPEWRQLVSVMHARQFKPR